MKRFIVMMGLVLAAVACGTDAKKSATEEPIAIPEVARVISGFTTEYQHETGATVSSRLTFGYDDAGRIVRMEASQPDMSSVTEIDYLEGGVVKVRELPFDANSFRVNAEGYCTAIVSEEMKFTTFEYDASGRLASYNYNWLYHGKEPVSEEGIMVWNDKNLEKSIWALSWGEEAFNSKWVYEYNAGSNYATNLDLNWLVEIKMYNVRFNVNSIYSHILCAAGSVGTRSANHIVSSRDEANDFVTTKYDWKYDAEGYPVSCKVACYDDPNISTKPYFTCTYKFEYAE